MKCSGRHQVVQLQLEFTLHETLFHPWAQALITDQKRGAILPATPQWDPGWLRDGREECRLKAL